jgi:hypothetical protein
MSLRVKRTKATMNTFHQRPVRYHTISSTVAIAFMMTFVACSPALAAPGGDPHVGGVHGAARAHAGHFRGGRVGAYGRGYHGFGGGYGYHGGWGGLGAGLFFATLPLYYSTLWWNGTPYYYADANYYQWNAAAGEYETVRPPPEVESQINTQEPAATDLFAYPINGQDTQLQAQDRYECHRWAREQSGFDPTQTGGVPDEASTPPSGVPVADTVATPVKRQNYLRAQAACLEGRGYSVK